MHETQRKILQIFVKQHNTPLNTTELLSQIYDVTEIAEDKAALAKLHRKLLHHLNSLVKQDILDIESIGSKGLKQFVPKIGPDQELVIGSKDKIILSSKSNPDTPIDAYEKIITKIGGDQWTRKVNAILLESQLAQRLEDFTKLIEHALLCVNDCVALNDFETLVEQFGFEKVRTQIEEINRSLKAQDKSLCIIIDFTNITRPSEILRMVGFITKLNSTNMIIVLDITTREFMLHKDLCLELFKQCAAVHTPFHIKHDDVIRAPSIIGQNGTYTLNSKEWESYIKNGFAKAKGLVVNQLCAKIDVKALTETFRLAKDINHVFVQTAKSLFIAHTVQRKNSEQIFSPLTKLGYTQREFFLHSQSSINISGLLDPPLMDELHEDLMLFGYKQNLVYVGCGMPTQFSLVFSHAHSSPHTIKHTQDIHEDETQQFLQNEERIHRICSGGYSTNIHRSGSPKARAVFAEVALILNSFSIPCLTYTFDRIDDATKKLGEYFDGD